MGSPSFKSHLDKIDSWINGRRVVHFDNEAVDIAKYEKQWSKMAKQFLIENGENIRWQGTNTSGTFIKECKDNNLKAVVCDIKIDNGSSGIDVVKKLVEEGIIKCPIFFVSGKSYNSLDNHSKRQITDMRARYIEKSIDDEQVRKDIMEIVSDK